MRRVMAEVGHVLEGFKERPPGPDLTLPEQFKLALLHHKTELLKAKKKHLSSLEDLREHTKIVAAAEEFLHKHAPGGGTRAIANEKWGQLVAWSRKAEELVGLATSQIASLPGFLAGVALPPLEELGKLRDGVPVFRREMMAKLRDLNAEIPADVCFQGQIDRHFEAYLLFTERTSAATVPRVKELLSSMSESNPANALVAALDRYEGAVKALIEKRSDQIASLEVARRFYEEGSYFQASAQVASLGSRYSDLDYSIVDKIRNLEAEVSQLDRMDGKELMEQAERIAAENPWIPADSQLDKKLRRSRDRGSLKRARSRILIAGLSMTTVLALAASFFIGKHFIEVAKEEEEERQLRQAEELKRSREIEAQAEAHRALMSEQARKAELNQMASRSQAGNSEADAELLQFTNRHKTVPLSVPLPEPSPEILLLWVPPGSFLMGAMSGATDNRLRSVSITKGFWLGRTEVTQAQWRSLMSTSPSAATGDDLPVEQVHWNEAQNFCRLLTDREQASGRLPKGLMFTLPTEAQWEYACRSGEEGDFPKALAESAWIMENSGFKTNPVGQRKPNAWGLYDMLGNVSEWCLDWYEPYPSGNVIDPVGPKEGRRRINRGGGWFGANEDYNFPKRDKDVPAARSKSVGFRVALVNQ